MRAVVLRRFGIENLMMEDVPKPVAASKEILVRMQAASLNYVDLAIVEGTLDTHLPLPFIPVADGSGVVESVGSEVRGFSPGDLVCTVYIPPWQGGRYTADLTGLEIRPGTGHLPGQLSEYKAFTSNELVQAPPHLSAEEASTLPIAGLTAWNALIYGRIRPGQTVLIHGTGGVSIFALQFAKLFGAKVIVTSSSDTKLERAREFGADGAVNYANTASVTDEILGMNNGSGVDLVIETVGGPNVQRSLEVLRPEGHISVVGFLSGITATVNLITLNLNRATMVGVSVGSKQDFQDMAAAMSQSELRPVIDACFPIEKTREAFALLKSGKHFGKVVIRL